MYSRSKDTCELVQQAEVGTNAWAPASQVGDLERLPPLGLAWPSTSQWSHMENEPVMGDPFSLQF